MCKKTGAITMKSSVGRPPKVNYKIMFRLADALQYSASVSDACRYAGISRDTFYHYMNSNPVFSEMMCAAKKRQHEIVFSSLTTPW